MSKLFENPHIIFLFSIPILLLYGVFNKESMLDINVHDTYFVIAHFHLTILMSIPFTIFGIGYWLIKKTNKRLSKWMTKAHVGLTFGGIFCIVFLLQLYREDIMEYRYNVFLSLIITVVVFVIIIGQLFFPFNIIYGLINKSR